MSKILLTLRGEKNQMNRLGGARHQHCYTQISMSQFNFEEVEFTQTFMTSRK